jgi:serine/threonine protein kinase
MATGRLPFKGDTSAAIFDSVLHKSPVPAVRLNQEVPADLEHLINRAIEKDRHLRYQHASDMRAELQRLAAEKGSLLTARTARLARFFITPGVSRVFTREYLVSKFLTCVPQSATSDRQFRLLKKFCKPGSNRRPGKVLVLRPLTALHQVQTKIIFREHPHQCFSQLFSK